MKADAQPRQANCCSKRKSAKDRSTQIQRELLENSTKATAAATAKLGI